VLCQPFLQKRKVSRLVQHREPRRQPCRENKESLSVSPIPRAREITLQRKQGKPLNWSNIESKEEQTVPRYWLISAKNKVVVRDRMEALLHQTSPNMIKLHQRPSDSSPRTTRKSYGGDAQERIRPDPSLEQPERVMEMIQRVETLRLGVSELWGLGSARFLSSNNPKGSWKGYKGLKPLGWGFPEDKAKDIQKRIRPDHFLGQPERVMERAQRVETSRLEVSEG
jgi:hypothetical protein